MSNFLFVLLLLAMFATLGVLFFGLISMARGGEFNKRDRKSTRLNSSHIQKSRMPSSA